MPAATNVARTRTVPIEALGAGDHVRLETGDRYRVTGPAAELDPFAGTYIVGLVGIGAYPPPATRLILPAGTTVEVIR